MTSDELARRQAGNRLDIADLVARLQPALRPVPASGDIVCERCHSSANPGYRFCRRCGEVENALDGFGLEVVPISLSVHRGQLHDHLRQYKSGPERSVRYRMATTLGGLLATFIRNHTACLGPWDTVGTVPSHKHDPHPLHELVSRIRSLRDQLKPLLLANPALTDLGREPHPERYLINETTDIASRRILLIDDTFTSGASTQSAAYALTSAGASSVVALVIGRHVNPTWSPSASLLRRLRDEAWHPDRCLKCHPLDLGTPGLL